MDWDVLRKLDLTMFSTPWCGDCRRLKRIFAANQIPHRERDIDADPEAAVELKRATGRTAIPFVQINGGSMVRGWHADNPMGFDADQFFAEVAVAIGSGD